MIFKENYSILYEHFLKGNDSKFISLNPPEVNWKFRKVIL